MSVPIGATPADFPCVVMDGMGRGGSFVGEVIVCNGLVVSFPPITGLVVYLEINVWSRAPGEEVSPCEGGFKLE